MGSWRRMGAFLGLVPEDDPRYGDEDFAAYDEMPEPEYRPHGAPRRRDDYPEPVTHGALAVQPEPELRRPVSESASAARPLTVKLTGFAEARIIGERYRGGASVILDMTDLTDGDARRVVDFAAGLAFALHGSIDKVTARVFMLLPPHAGLTAEDRRAVAGDYARR